MKKYLKLLIAIIILSLLAAAAYILFSRSPAIQQLTVNLFPSSSKTNKTPSEETAVRKFGALTDTLIFDYWINSKNNSIYYLNETGQVIKNTNGSEELVNSQTLLKLNRLTASPDGAFALAKFNYPTFPTFSIFNTVNNTWQPLPANTIAAAWSPNSQSIAYADSKALKIFNLLTQKTQEVLKLSQKELNLDWLSDSQILLSADSGLAVKMMLLNLNNKTLTPFLEETGLAIKWSDDRGLGIKFNDINGTPATSLLDKNGNTLSRFTFVTLPSKCLIQKNKIYCAVPKNISSGLKLPGDYYKKAIYFDDAFYLIDLSNAGVSQLTTGSEAAIDAEHLEISDGKLLFKNRLDDKLYNITL